MYAKWAKQGTTTAHKGETGESAEELFAKVARSDKHKISLADEVYAALTPEEDARLSKHCFHRLMGQSVAFPSTDEWKEQGRPIEEIVAKARHDRVIAEARGGADDEEEEDEEFDAVGADCETDPTDDWVDILDLTSDSEKNADAPASRNPQTSLESTAVEENGAECEGGEEEEKVDDEEVDPDELDILAETATLDSAMRKTIASTLSELKQIPGAHITVGNGELLGKRGVLKTFQESEQTWVIDFDDDTPSQAVPWELISVDEPSAAETTASMLLRRVSQRFE